MFSRAGSSYVQTNAPPTFIFTYLLQPQIEYEPPSLPKFGSENVMTVHVKMNRMQSAGIDGDVLGIDKHDDVNGSDGEGNKDDADDAGWT